MLLNGPPKCLPSVLIFTAGVSSPQDWTPEWLYKGLTSVPFRPVRPHQNTWQVLIAPDMSVCLGPFHYMNRSLSGSNIGFNHGLSTNNRNSCDAQSSSLSSVFSLCTSALAASWLASSSRSFSIILLVLSLVLTMFWYMVSIRFLALVRSSLVFFLLGLHSDASSCRKASTKLRLCAMLKSDIANVNGSICAFCQQVHVYIVQSMSQSPSRSFHNAASILQVIAQSATF